MTNFKLHAATLAAALVSLPIGASAAEGRAAPHPDAGANVPEAATAEVAGQDAARAPQGAAPFQLSLWDSVQVIDRERSIHGLRLALPYGRNWDVQGVDIGIVNRTDHDLTGAQFSLAALVDGDLKGLQYDLLFGAVAGEVQGVQMSFVNTAGKLQGAQFGAVNYARDGAIGAGFSVVNVYEGPAEGLSLGAVNYARRIEGVQFGIVNVAGQLHGVQIGLINVARNGFLPVFPILNAAL